MIDLLARATRTCGLASSIFYRCRHGREFHEGRHRTLPDFYHHEYERALGPYAELISRDDRRPDLTPYEAGRPAP